MISSRNNEIIRKARSLRERGARRQSGAFLVEGIHLVGAAIEARWPIEVVLYSGELLTSQYARDLVEHFSGRVEEVSADVLESLSSKQNPVGILAIAERRFQNLGRLKASKYAAAVASPQDPGNLGTILRTLDAVGGSALFVLNKGVDPFHPTAVRAAMGASFEIPMVDATFDEFDGWRRAQGVQLIGSSTHALTDYRDIRPIVPCVLLLGSEQKGLSDIQQQACDVVVRVPMRGHGTSLNLAVAAGILLFEYAAVGPE